MARLGPPAGAGPVWELMGNECVVRGRSEGLVRQGKQRKRSVFFLILSHNSSSLNVLFKEKGRDKKGEITIK